MKHVLKRLRDFSYGITKEFMVEDLIDLLNYVAITDGALNRYGKHEKDCLYDSSFLVGGKEKKYPCTCKLLAMQEWLNQDREDKQHVHHGEHKDS